ncbi:hypothetical protein [Asticcacaulis solisilvae]|uniref:hypothetical protein n=1 Tax=Asticcacaulis solisilvae TaxID=1217274 RepID=UPI003FD7D582
MLTLLHTKFGIGPHRWQAFGEEKLFDPENPSVQTAVKIRRRCACGTMLTTMETTGFTTAAKATATQIL